jgi:hypothetical protein
MTSHSQRSFSPGRKWSLSLNTLVAVLAVLALLLMTNYLAARHYARWSWSANAQTELSPLSRQVINSITNPVKVTIYFDKTDPLYEMSWNLLKAYHYANHRIQLEPVDYTREPGAAQLAKARYKLSETDRDIIIFDCQGRSKVVYQGDLSDRDLQPLLTGQSREVKRTHFKGEALFTSALFNVTNARQPKAYFLEGHGEHHPESDDGVLGYSGFAGVLRENNILVERLRLEGPRDIPADCNLLIVAGPRTTLESEVLGKIDRYLKQGGRLFLLFSYQSVLRQTGLERSLLDWDVAVGRNVVIDEKNFHSSSKNDLVSSTFGTHPIIKPLYGKQLYLVLPRSISRSSRGGSGADAPQVDLLVYTSTAGRAITDIRADGSLQPSPGDVITNVPLVAVVEKGGIRNVSADRGTTRMVIAGDSLFLANDNLEREANHEFAAHAINWLLARNDLLVGVAPRPMSEYKLTMTGAQMAAARWLLVGAFPGSALLIGTLVWLRRRR